MYDSLRKTFRIQLLFLVLGRGKIFKKAIALNYAEPNYQKNKSKNRNQNKQKSLRVKYTHSKVQIRDLKVACGKCRVNSAQVFPPLLKGSVN